MNTRGLMVVALTSLTLCAVAYGADEPAAKPGVLVEWKLVQAEPATKDGKLSADLRRLFEADESTDGRSGPRYCVVLSTDFDVDGFLAPKDKDEPLRKLLAGPRIAAVPGEQATIRVGQHIPYMVKRDDGSLVVEHSPEFFEGAELKLLVGLGDENLIDLEDARLRLTRVTGRQPIEGVPFEVGRPIMTTQEMSVSLTVAPGCWILIRLPQLDGNDSVFLAFLRATVVSS